MSKYALKKYHNLNRYAMKQTVCLLIIRSTRLNMQMHTSPCRIYQLLFNLNLMLNVHRLIATAEPYFKQRSQTFSTTDFLQLRKYLQRQILTQIKIK